MSGHHHYCGCGRSWACGNEGCTEDDVCRACSAFNGEEDRESSHRREE
jgi:hypothetical protein